jgi:hypothetical protein
MVVGIHHMPLYRSQIDNIDHIGDSVRHRADVMNSIDRNKLFAAKSMNVIGGNKTKNSLAYLYNI